MRPDDVDWIHDTIEAVGLPDLETQSPSTLGWRLRVERRNTNCFVQIIDSRRTIRPQGQSPLPIASDPP
jgi:hypothetical protein